VLQRGFPGSLQRLNVVRGSSLLNQMNELLVLEPTAGQPLAGREEELGGTIAHQLEALTAA
jgi:hypothetical protein